MASDVRIFTGTAWESIKGAKGDTGAAGPAGAPGPTAVSTDAGQLAKLGTDAKVLVASADLDARYVNLTGDTMTGALSVGTTLSVTGATTCKNTLAVTSTGTFYSGLDVSGRLWVGGNLVMPTGTAFIQNGGMTQSRTATDPAVNATGGVFGVSGTSAIATGFQVNTSGGTNGNYGFRVGTTPAAASNYGCYIDCAAQNYFKGNVGIGILAPTVPLEVSGATILRGTVNITGNITSAGTAHAFAAKSIPVSALSAFPTVPTGTPASQTAAGVAGQVQYDASYLYLAIGANDWRRIPLSDWSGSAVSGPVSDPTMTSVVPVTSVSATGPVVGVANISFSSIPANATGIAIQHKIVGGTWTDTDIASYMSGGSIKPSFEAMKTGGTNFSVQLLGLTPGTAYITRAAWRTSVGIGTWTGELTAVTPTK